jgi:hypothetical protein
MARPGAVAPQTDGRLADDQKLPFHGSDRLRIFAELLEAQTVWLQLQASADESVPVTS